MLKKMPKFSRFSYLVIIISFLIFGVGTLFLVKAQSEAETTSSEVISNSEVIFETQKTINNETTIIPESSSETINPETTTNNSVIENNNSESTTNNIISENNSSSSSVIEPINSSNLVPDPLTNTNPNTNSITTIDTSIDTISNSSNSEVILPSANNDINLNIPPADINAVANDLVQEEKQEVWELNKEDLVADEIAPENPDLQNNNIIAQENDNLIILENKLNSVRELWFKRGENWNKIDNVKNQIAKSSALGLFDSVVFWLEEGRGALFAYDIESGTFFSQTLEETKPNIIERKGEKYLVVIKDNNIYLKNIADLLSAYLGNY
jgi:hypothetical protein